MGSVLVVYDVDGWAQHRHAAALEKHAEPGTTVRTVSLAEYRRVASPAWLRAWDAIYHIYLYTARHRDEMRRLVGCVASHAWMHPCYDSRNWRTKGVNAQRNCKTAKTLLPGWDAAICRSRELLSWAGRYARNAACFPAGIDTAVFRPRQRPLEGPRRLRIGWCGQIRDKIAGTNFKGHAEILTPLRDQFTQYEWDVNIREYTNALDTPAMVEWYQGLDVFLTTSSADGTPNPPFEAAACGVPVISTDVGAVRDWQALRELDMVVPDYGNEREAAVARAAIAERLAAFADDAGLRERCRLRLLESIRDEYDYRLLAPRILEYVLG